MSGKFNKIEANQMRRASNFNKNSIKNISDKPWNKKAHLYKNK